jgi:multidrug efflux pump subunit AcrB
MIGMNLSALAVRERAITLFFIILSVVGGIYAFLALGRAEDPAFTVRIMLVNVAWPGASPKEMQEQVVDRLEKRIQEVESLYRIETTIRAGQATLQVEFQDYTPQAKVPTLFYEVRKRMQDATRDLPTGVIGPIVVDDFSDVYFTLLALNAPGLPLSALSREAEPIRDRLQNIPGVRKAVILADRSERVFVDFDSARLINLGISPQAIFDAIDQSNRLLPTGRIETLGPRLYLRLDADLADIRKLADTPIRVGDRIIRVGDIANVRHGYEDPPSLIARAQGQETVLIGLVMQAGENGLILGERINRALSAERAALPLGMTITQLTNQADAIKAAVSLFQIKFLIALAVVMGVSILVIGLRAGLTVGIAVPLTLGISFIVMQIMGINLDRVTLGALIIALGLLVDDAIIAVEMMLVKMEQGWDRVRAAAHAWTATAAPLLFGTLVTVAGFFPIGFAKSGVGEYAGNIFWVLAVALIVSWIVAVVFVPYLGVKILADFKHPGGDAHPAGAMYQTRTYRALRSAIATCVFRRKSVVVATVVLLGLSVFGLVALVQKQFFPGSDRPEILISVSLPQGSSIAVTDRTMKKLETLLRAMPEVETLAAFIGGGAPRFFISADPEPPDPAFGKIVAVAKDVAARDKAMAKLGQYVDDGAFPEARVRIYRLLYGPPVSYPVQLRVIGPDANVLRSIATRVREVVRAHPDIADPHLEWDERVPVLRLVTDADRLRLLGFTPQDVAQQLQFQIEGVSVTELRRDIKTVSLVARGAVGGDRIDAARIASIELLNRQGRKVPLTQIARLEVGFEEPVIKLYNRELFIAVRADLASGQPNTVTDELWTNLAPIRSTLPEGYRIDIGGSVEQSEKANASIQKLQPVMVAFMLIFIMLQMRSFAGTFMVVATAPLGLIGAVIALLVFNQPFGFVALLGLTGIAGILMRNTLILTQQISDNYEAGMEPFQSVVEAAVQRARPVVLTALAAVFAFVPLTQDSFWGPLAYVLIGGTAVGTLITLLFVPALYALWFRIKRPVENILSV